MKKTLSVLTDVCLWVNKIPTYLCGLSVAGLATKSRPRINHLSAVPFILACLYSSTSFAADFSNKFSNWLLGEEAQASVDIHGQPNLDELSNACLSCHNGYRAKKIEPITVGALRHGQDNGNSGHPVGMDYAVSAAKKPGAYNARASLAPAIVLVDGKVACVSCHAIKTPAPATGFIKVGFQQDGGNEDCIASDALTVGPRATDLCLSCHNM